jgi:hypothetical protein
MKLDSTDLPKLQLSLIAAALMLAVGIGTVLFSLDAHRAKQLVRSTAQAERDEFDGKLKRIRLEEDDIRSKSAVFSILQTRGVVGDEQRLEWVELLKAIREQRQLIDFQYEIAPQRPLDATAGSGLSYFVSTMKIQLKLLHEEDLTRFLDDLRLQAKALIQVKSCNVSRLPRSSSGQGTPALLQADCQIDWVTLREGSAK